MVRAGVLALEERLRGWDFFSLGKRWLQGGPAADPQHSPWWGAAVRMTELGCVWQKLKQEFQAGYKETFSCSEDSQTRWIRLPREVPSVLGDFQDLTK